MKDKDLLLMLYIVEFIKLRGYRFWFRIGAGVAMGGILAGIDFWDVPMFFLAGVGIAICIDVILLLSLYALHSLRKADI